MNHQESPIFENFEEQKRLTTRIYRAIEKKKVVAQGGKFDLKWLKHHFGMWFPMSFDTLLAHYNLDENDKHDLTHLAMKYCGLEDDYDIPLKEKHGFGDLETHCKYLAQDIYYTRKLAFIFKRMLAEDPQTEAIYNNITLPASWLYARVEHRGIYVDQKKLQRQRRYWERARDKAFKRLTRLCPSDNKWKDKKTKEWKYGVNWNSPKQVAEILFDKLGLKSIKETGTGARSTDESVLLRLGPKHKVPQLILDHRAAEKNLGTFINRWIEESWDGRIHPSFKIHGTVTGRPSCTDPNLQQTPRDPKLRGCYTAPPGYTLIAADYSQIELRIIAHVSKDPALLFAYQTGQDIHTKTVQNIIGIPNPTKEERKRGKAINFGFIYGMGWPKFVDYGRDNYQVEFTSAEARTIRTRFFLEYNGLPPWHKRMRRFARNQGYVRNLVGRLRRLPDAQMSNERHGKCQNALRQAINAPIQGFGSDLTITAALDIDLKVKHCDIVGTVHDEILMEVPNGRVMEVATQVKEIMEGYRILRGMGADLSIPIIAEVSQGPWGDNKEIKFDN